MKRYARASDIKVGVVGYGGAFEMGKQHLREMRAAGMKPSAVAEIDPERLSAAERDFPGIKTYPSIEALLKGSDADLLAIITPHDTHAPLALKALRAGRNVVCEKPFAVTTAECDAMIAAAKKSGVMVSTYHNRHWDGCILRAVREIRKGAIGDVYRIEAHMGGRSKPGDTWRGSKSGSGSVLHDWGVHLLEYGLQIIDSDIVEVCGFLKTGFWAPKTRWKKDTIEDEGFLSVRFAGGQWMTLCMTRLDSNPKRGQLEITGTKGTYIFDYRTWEVIQPRSGRTVVTKGAHPPSQGWRFYRNVADHLTGGEKLVITPQWARRPIHIVDLACRGAVWGRAMKAKYK